MLKKTDKTKFLRAYLELCKIRISFFAALSAFTGFILTGSGLTNEILIPVIGVFLLACGACAMNQYQERGLDALMSRTRERPLPSGRLKPLHALCFSIILLAAGLFILSIKNAAVFMPGLFAVVLYNGVYTYLKRITAFAAVPGALVGTIPPAIGWISGGGIFPDYQILVICFLFYIWQIPHFWLLYLKNESDYKNAGLPLLSNIFSNKQIRRITFIWIFASAVTCLMIPLYGSSFHIINIPIVATAVWLGWSGVNLVNKKKSRYSYAHTFNKINIFMLVIMSLLNLERLLSPLL
jgi:protoheme IX farnesyltransferase